LITEVIADDAAGFGATLGVRDPRIVIFRVTCPDAPAWKLLDWHMMTLTDLVFATGAPAITRLLLGFLGGVRNWRSLH
jgi:hypothetical protein